MAEALPYTADDFEVHIAIARRARQHMAAVLRILVDAPSLAPGNSLTRSQLKARLYLCQLAIDRAVALLVQVEQ
jgi:hypothetical protein